MKIFQRIKNFSESTTKILGFTIYKKEFFDGNLVIRKYLQGLVTIKEKNGISKFYFLGLKYLKKVDIEKIISQKLRVVENNIIKKVQRSITTALLHQKTFLPFKNCNQGKKVVLVGAGPTVTDFIPMKNVIYCGCNRAFLFDKVEFDYLFAIDKSGISEYYDEFLHYGKKGRCIKFIGDQNTGIDFQIPESYAIKLNGLRYKTTTRLTDNKFTFDIASEPLGNFRTVSLQAMQFLLYTNPQKIYIVGIDCTFGSKGHFVGNTPDITKRGENPIENDLISIEDYKKLKFFAQMYYPETEIISINPVGLKGVFDKDIYTNSDGNYVDENGNLVELENV